jgi:hypothetical protein
MDNAERRSYSGQETLPNEMGKQTTSSGKVRRIRAVPSGKRNEIKYGTIAEGPSQVLIEIQPNKGDNADWPKPYRVKTYRN